MAIGLQTEYSDNFNKKKNVNNMKIATINIPDDYLNCIEILVNLGYYPSRSECVREALKQFLGREATLNENLKVENFQKLKSTQMNSLIH